MDSNRQLHRWLTSTALSFWGTTIQSVFAFIIISFILYIYYNLTDSLLAGIMPSLANMNYDYYEDRFNAFAGVIGICFLISFLGYIAYLVGICLFKRAQNSPDSESRAFKIMLAKLIMPALLILLVVIVYNYGTEISQNFESTVSLILLPWVVYLSAVIYLLIQFKSLSRESTWTDKARLGADNLKFSYACILWILAIIIFGLLIIFMTVLSYKSKLEGLQYGSYGMNEVVGGINSLSKLIEDIYNTIKIEVLFIFLAVFIFEAMLTIYRILGWYRIYKGGIEEISDQTTFPTNGSRCMGQGKYCHKCGAELPEDSSFCPNCGTQIVKVVSSSPGGVTDNDSEETDVTVDDSADKDSFNIVYEDDETDNRKKWMLWGGIAAAIILAVICFFIFKGGDKGDGTLCNIYNHSATVYKTVEDWSSSDPQGELEYGDPVTVYEKDPSGNWIEVKTEKNGKTLKGYVEVKSIMDANLFNILNQRGYMNEENVRYNVKDAKSRRALAEKLNELGEDWKLATEENDYGIHPISKSCFIEGLTPSEEGFGFMAINDNSGDKQFFLFSFDDNDNPVEVYQESVASKWNGISDIIVKRGKIKVNYYQSESSDEEEVYEANNMLTYTGNVDNQYPITMSLSIDGGSVTGSYYYNKYKTPISLSGEITNNDEGGRSILLTEMNNGVVSGQFLGTFNGSSISGSWISADGEKEMPFYVEEKY